MKKTINDFINSIDTKLYSRIRASKGDAECRKYLKEHLQKQCDIHVVSKSLPLPAERWDAEELLNSKDVFNHPRVETRLNDDSFEVADLMAEFANKYYGNVC